MDKTVFRIFRRDTDEAVGSYSRAHHDEYEFSSADAARNANVHDEFLDYKKYRIAEYRVRYELIRHDVR